jgi:esterase/lipase superfamily enzyme
MNGEYHAWRSPSLGQTFELKSYGFYGRPLVVFPSSQGRFYQFEDFGMLEACRPWLESGRVRIFAVDGIDSQSWWNAHAHPADKARRHEDYDACIVGEIVPFVRDRCGGGGIPIMAAGCSFGAYHAANFLFRHPDIFDASICMSGVYSVREFVGDYHDDRVYYNDPLEYLPNLTDPWYLDRYRRSRIVICAGQGAWEDRFLASSRELSRVLCAKEVDHWLDVWGHDVNHDWPWWRKQIGYFLDHLV